MPIVQNNKAKKTIMGRNIDTMPSVNPKTENKKPFTYGGTYIKPPLMPHTKHAEVLTKKPKQTSRKPNNNYLLDIPIVGKDDPWITIPAPRPEENRCGTPGLGIKNDENYTWDEMTMLLIIAHKLDPREAHDYKGLSEKLTVAFGREVTYKSISNKMHTLEETWPEEVERVKALSPMHQSVQNTDRFLKLGLKLWMPYLLPTKQDQRRKYKGGEMPWRRRPKDKPKKEPDLDRVQSGRVTKESPRKPQKKSLALRLRDLKR